MTTAAPAQVGLDGLVDLLDRVLDAGVAVSGDVVISLAGVDLIQLDLRLLLTGVSTESSTALEAVTRGTVTPGTVTPGTVTPGTVTPGTVTPGTVM